MIWGLTIVATTSDCQVKIPNLYKAALLYLPLRLFLKMFEVVNTIGVMVVFAFLIRNGTLARLLGTTATTPAAPGTLEAQKVLPFNQLPEGETSCCICLADYSPEVEIRQTICDHRFCTPCLEGWLEVNHVCPLCRADLSVPGHPSELEGP